MDQEEREYHPQSQYNNTAIYEVSKMIVQCPVCGDERERVIEKKRFYCCHCNSWSPIPFFNKKGRDKSDFILLAALLLIIIMSIASWSILSPVTREIKTLTEFQKACDNDPSFLSTGFSECSRLGVTDKMISYCDVVEDGKMLTVQILTNKSDDREFIIDNSIIKCREKR